MLNKFIIFNLFLFVTACNSGKTYEQVSIHQYYDLKGAVKKQLVLLDSLDPLVKKTTIIDGEKEVRSIKLDSSAWAKELNIFLQADINKPVLKDSYHISEKVLGKDQSLRVFEAKNKKKIGVEILKVFLSTKDSTTNKIEAFYKEKNALYNSQRKMTLNFKEEPLNHLIDSYKVEGKQKMILKDTVHFQIEANLLY